MADALFLSILPVRGGGLRLARMTDKSLWLLVVFVAVWAGVMDWRYRRIPNWLTLPATAVGLLVNAALGGWAGVKASLLGLGFGLLVLLPFVVLKAIGGGDWKLVGALGAFLGPNRVISVLIGSLIVAGAMATVLVVGKGRVRQTLHNMAHLVRALMMLRMPPHEVSLDNPDAAKVPFGVAVAVTVILFGAGHWWGRLA